VVRDHLVGVCAQRGFTPRIKDAATGHAAQVHLVAGGHGICLVPRTALAMSRAPVSFVVIEGVEVDLVAVTRPHPPPPIHELVAVLGRNASLEPRPPSFTSG
jgi:DNA-binding transcriptional LysR family regulator